MSTSVLSLAVVSVLAAHGASARRGGGGGGSGTCYDDNGNVVQCQPNVGLIVGLVLGFVALFVLGTICAHHSKKKKAKAAANAAAGKQQPVLPTTYQNPTLKSTYQAPITMPTPAAKSVGEAPPGYQARPGNTQDKGEVIFFFTIPAGQRPGHTPAGSIGGAQTPGAYAQRPGGLPV